MSETRKLAAILVADVVGYSRLAGLLKPTEISIVSFVLAELGKSGSNAGGVVGSLRGVEPRPSFYAVGFRFQACSIG
jgi:hypothetical protein